LFTRHGDTIQPSDCGSDSLIDPDSHTHLPYEIKNERCYATGGFRAAARWLNTAVKVETITVNIIESLVIETSFALWNSVSRYFRAHAVQNNSSETLRLAADTPGGRLIGPQPKSVTIFSVCA
jgi:hypothetical protein